jgi:hypothetical protein
MALALGAAGLTAPSQAAITTFADYQTVGTGSNFYWKNNGTGNSNGTGGSLYTISNAAATVPGTAQINFSFLQPALSSISNVIADFTLLATASSSPAVTAGGFKIQPGITGSFTIKSTSAITLAGTTYAAGANLLSGSFNNASIFGQANGTSGSVSSATTSGATITYTSDFLSFLPTVERDFSLSLTSITPPLASNTGRALRTFRGVSTGSFSSDPAPTPLLAVPESATWAMFIMGFGLMGATTRSRRRVVSLA